MRVKVAIMSGAVLVLTAGTGAAYAVVGHSSVSPTVTGNTLPIDNNHSSTAHRSTAPRSTAHREPGDDRGRAVEPGDDRTEERGTDDPAGSTDSASAAPATAASPSTAEDHHRGQDGPGHH